MLEAAEPLVAGVEVILGVVVVVDLGFHRAEDRHVVHALRQLRKLLDDVDAGHGGLCRFEFAAGLGIEGVLLAGSAIHPQEDAGSCRAAAARWPRPRPGTRTTAPTRPKARRRRRAGENRAAVAGGVATRSPSPGETLASFPLDGSSER